MRESLSGITDSSRRSLVVMLIVDALGRLRQSIVSRCSWKFVFFFTSDRKSRKANRCQLHKSCFLKAKMHLQVRATLVILNSFSKLLHIRRCDHQVLSIKFTICHIGIGHRKEEAGGRSFKMLEF